MTKAGDAAITLTSDGALALFELLPRWKAADRVIPPDHRGEQVPHRAHGIPSCPYAASDRSK